MLQLLFYGLTYFDNFCKEFFFLLCLSLLCNRYMLLLHSCRKFACVFCLLFFHILGKFVCSHCREVDHKFRILICDLGNRSFCSLHKILRHLHIATFRRRGIEKHVLYIMLDYTPRKLPHFPFSKDLYVLGSIAMYLPRPCLKKRALL